MRRCLTGIGAALLASLPTLAIAAEEAGAHHAGPDWGLLGLAVLNTGLLAILLLRFARKPIRGFLFQRREEIRRALQEAEGRLAAAQQEIALLNARLQNLDRETREIREFAQQQAAGERERMGQRATETAERIRQDAERVASREIDRARQALRDEAANLATTMAAELLRTNITAADDKRLADEFVQRVNGGAA
jgi:F-type H+-transporting ATPase subunit b